MHTNDQILHRNKRSFCKCLLVDVCWVEDAMDSFGNSHGDGGGGVFCACCHKVKWLEQFLVRKQAQPENVHLGQIRRVQ